MICTSIDQTVGNTPLLELVRTESVRQLKAKVLLKLESFNPAGSAKDRVAKAMLDEGERQGLLNKDTVIIEPTSGNTGIGLSLLGAARGYRVIILMPDTMSPERRQLMAAYGAQVILTPGAKGMAGAIEKANELHASLPNSWIAGQFDNPANPKAHFDTTGPEIWRDTEGKVDIFVAGVGTGGTVTGAGEYLKSQNPSLRVVAVEPATSAVLSGEKPGPHGLQGIGAGFIPSVLHRDVYDEIIKVTDADAMDTGRMLARTEGVLTGISSGAAVFAALALAGRPENAGKVIVALCPDTGDHYLSTPLFEA